MNIEIKYDGAYPCLCSGNLYVKINGKEYDFGTCYLQSGGSVTFTDDWEEEVTQGKWIIDDDGWPDNFPLVYKDDVLEAINEQIPHGCCGGCV